MSGFVSRNGRRTPRSVITSGTLRSIKVKVGRGYETTLSLFMSFITDGRYGWSAECLERFGQVPQQVFHEDWSTRGSLKGGR